MQQRCATLALSRNRAAALLVELHHVGHLTGLEIANWTVSFEQSNNVVMNSGAVIAA